MQCAPETKSTTHRRRAFWRDPPIVQGSPYPAARPAPRKLPQGSALVPSEDAGPEELGSLLSYNQQQANAQEYAAHETDL